MTKEIMVPHKSDNRFPGQIVFNHITHWARRIADTFWFVPALCIVASVFFAQTMLYFDSIVELDGRIPILGWVADVGADGARSMLSAIGTAMLGVAATAFSITISVIATASSNYGPRLVQNFMADRGNQIVLGMLSATFIYALLVLRTIRSASETRELYVPHLSISVAIVLALVDVAMLVWFIHHIADSIQVNTIAQGVRQRWLASVRRWFPKERPGQYGDFADYPYPINAANLQQAPGASDVVTDDNVTTALYPEQTGQTEPALIALEKIGYLVEIDMDAIADFAHTKNLRIVLLKRVGDHVVSDEPVLQVWPASRCDDVAAEIRRQFAVDDSRTTYQDLRFAQQQLVELAVRALSSGTNDPYTAVNAINELGAGMTIAVSRPHPGDVILREDQPRLWYRPITQAEILEMPFDQIRPHATSSMIVIKALIDLARRTQAATIYPELADLAEKKIMQLVDELQESTANDYDVAKIHDYIQATTAKTHISWVRDEN